MLCAELLCLFVVVLFGKMLSADRTVSVHQGTVPKGVLCRPYIRLSFISFQAVLYCDCRMLLPGGCSTVQCALNLSDLESLT